MRDAAYAAYIFVGVPVKKRYLGFDYRNAGEYGLEFADNAPGRTPVYEVFVKRRLLAKDSSSRPR